MLFDARIRYLQKLREKQSKKFINWQEIFTRNFLGYALFAAGMNRKMWRHRNFISED